MSYVKTVLINKVRRHLSNFKCIDGSAQDPDPDPQKYADPQIRIQGVKYQPKTAKKNLFTPKPRI